MGSDIGDCNAEDLVEEGINKHDKWINEVELDDVGEPIETIDDFYARLQDEADESFKNGQGADD